MAAIQTPAQRAVISGHACELLRHLEGCARASVEDLGRARDLVNTVGNLTDTAAVTTAAAQLEDLVTEVWAHQ